MGQVPKRTDFNFSVVAVATGKGPNATLEPLSVHDRNPARDYVVRNDLTAKQLKDAMQLAEANLNTLSISPSRMMNLLGLVQGKLEGNYASSLEKRRALFSDAKDSFGAGVTVSTSRLLKLDQLRAYVKEAALTEHTLADGALRPYPAFELRSTGNKQGYAELNDSMVKFDILRYAPSAEAVRKVIDGFIAKAKGGFTERAALVIPLETDQQLYTNLALAIIAECSYYHVRYNIVLSRNYVHYVTQTPLDYDRDEDGNVITDEDGNPRFSRANTGNFRAFLANNLRVALDTKLSKKSRVLPTDTVLALSDLNEVRKRRADLGMVETEDRTDEHGLFAAVKDNMAMAVLNENSTSAESDIAAYDDRDGSLEFMPPVGGEDDRIVDFYDRALKRREALLGELGVAPQPFGVVDYSALPQLAAALASSDEEKAYYLERVEELQQVETLLRGLSHLPMVKSFGLGLAVAASDTSATGYDTTQLAACGAATTEAMATALSNPHIFKSAFGASVKMRSQLASSATGFNVGLPRIGAPAVPTIVNDQATLIATLQAFGEIPSLEQLLAEATAEWESWASGFSVGLAPGNINGAEIPWTPEQRVAEWNNDFAYPLVFDGSGNPSLNEAVASDRDYPSVVSPEYRSANKGVQEAIADSTLPKGSEEHLRWIPAIETILALTAVGASGMSHDGSVEDSFATPLTNVVRYWFEEDVYKAIVRATGIKADFTYFKRACLLSSNAFLETDEANEVEGDGSYLDDDLTEETGNQALASFGGFTSKQLSWFGQFFVKTTSNSAGSPPNGDGAKSVVPETLLGFYIATRLGKKLLDALRHSMLDADSHLYLPFAPMRASYAQAGFENGKQVMRLDSTAPLYTFDRLSKQIGPATAQQYITYNDEVYRKTLQRGERDPNYDKDTCLRDTVGAFDPVKGRTAPEHPEYLMFKNVAPGLRAMLHQLVALVRVQRERPQVAVTSVAPGGGKTFLGIVSALMAAEYCQAEGLPFRPLFLSPPKLIQNWHNDADKFTRGRVNVFTLDSQAFARRDNHMLRQQILSAPVNTIFVGSYDMTKSGGGANSLRLQVGDHTSAIGARLDYLLSLGFTHIFYDESHRTKNSTGQLNRIAAQLNAQKGVSRVLATGTFISNMLGDAHGQLAAADPVLAGPRSTFWNMVDHDGRAKGYTLLECQRYSSYLSSHTTMLNVQQRDWAYNLPLPVYTTHVANSYPKDSIDNLLKNQSMQEPGKDYLEALRYLAKFKLLGGMTVNDMVAEDLRFNTFMQSVYVYLKKLKEESEDAGILDIFNSMMVDNVDPFADEGDGEADDEDSEGDDAAERKAASQAAKQAAKDSKAAVKNAKARRDGEDEEAAQARSNLIDQLQQIQQGLIPALTQFVKDSKAAPFNGQGFTGLEGVDIKQGQLDLNIVTPAVKYCYYLLHKHFFQGSNKPAYSDMGGKKVLVVVQNVRSAVAVFRDMPSALKRHARLSFGAVPPNIEQKVNPAYLKDFDISQAELVASKYAFCNDPNVWLLVCTEKSVSEGYNFQIANRVVRIDIPFTPGEVKQTKSRVIRPDVSETYVRDQAYIDTIVTEHTIDIARFLALTSKTLQSLAFEFNRDPLYAEATQPDKDLPLVKLNIDTLMQVSTMDAMSHFTNGTENEDGTLRVFNYVAREQEFNRLELKGIEQELEQATRLCKKYGMPTRTALREDGSTIERPSLMVKLESSGMLEGSAMTLFEPAVAFVPCHKLRYLGLKVDSLDYVLNGTTEIADNLIDAHVYTEHGFGRLIDLNRAKGKKKGDAPNALGQWATATVLFPDGSVGNYATNLVTLVEGVKEEHEPLLNSMIDTEAWQKDGTFQMVSMEAVKTPKGTRFQKHRLEWNGRTFVRGEALWGAQGSDYLNHYDDQVKKGTGTGGKVTVLKPATPYTDGAHLEVRVDSGVTSRTAKEMVEEVGISDGDWISDGNTNYRVNFKFDIEEGNKSAVSARVVLTPVVDSPDGKAPVASGQAKSMSLAKFISNYGFKPQLLAEGIVRQAAMNKVRRMAVRSTKKGFVTEDGNIEFPPFYNAELDLNDDFQLVRAAKKRFTLTKALVFALLENNAAEIWNALAGMARANKANFTAFYTNLTGNARLPKNVKGGDDLAKAVKDIQAKFQRLRLTAETLNIGGASYGYLFIGENELKDFAAPLGTDANTMVKAYANLAEVSANVTTVGSYSGILTSAQNIVGWLEQQVANPHTNFLALPTSAMKDGNSYVTFAEAVSEAGGAGNLIAQSADLAKDEEFANPYDEAEPVEVSGGVAEPQETYDEPPAPEAASLDLLADDEQAPAPVAKPAQATTVEPRFKPETYVAPDAAEVNVESYVVFTTPGSTPATTLMLSLSDTGSGDFRARVANMRMASDYAYMRKSEGKLLRTRVKTKLFQRDTYRTLVRVTSADNLALVMDTLDEANMLDLSPFMFSGDASAHLDAWLEGFSPIVKKASNPNAFAAKVKIDARKTSRLLGALRGEIPIKSGKVLPVLCVADSAVADGDALYLMLVGFNARLSTVLRKLIKSGATTVVRAQGSITPLAQDDRPAKDATDTQVGASVAMRQWESLYSMAQHFAISEANFKAIRADLKEYSTGMVKAKATRAARK